MNATVRTLLALAAPAAVLALAAPAHARDAVVPSYDGTPIVTSFHPAEGLAPGGGPARRSARGPRSAAWSPPGRRHGGERRAQPS